MPAKKKQADYREIDESLSEFGGRVELARHGIWAKTEADNVRALQ